MYPKSPRWNSSPCVSTDLERICRKTVPLPTNTITSGCAEIQLLRIVKRKEMGAHIQAASATLSCRAWQGVAHKTVWKNGQKRAPQKEICMNREAGIDNFLKQPH